MATVAIYAENKHGVETTKDIYWRLDQPMTGTPVEVYWPDDDDWVPARFVMLPADGVVRVKWNKEGGTSEMPSYYVRVLGEQGDGDPPIKKFLHEAKPDWTQETVKTVAEKLKTVGIQEARALFEAVQDELAGRKDSINAWLKKFGFKILVPSTLYALRSHGERCLAHRKQEPKLDQKQAEETPDKTARQAQRPANPPQPVPRPPAPRLVQQREVTPPVPAPNPLQRGDMNPPRPVPASAAARADPRPPVPVSCTAGHPLAISPAPYDVNCDDCGVEVGQGASMWRCDACAYDLCNLCWGSRQQTAGILLPAQQQPTRAPVQVPDTAAPQGPPVFCPKRHPLKHMNPRHPVYCSHCGKEKAEKEKVWSCQFCGYDLCEECFEERGME